MSNSSHLPKKIHVIFYVISITDSEKDHVRRWDAASGYLLWDVELPTLSASTSGSFDVAFLGVGGSQKDVIALNSGGVLTRLGGSVGKKVWLKELEKDRKYVKLVVSSKTVYVLSITDANDLEVAEVDAQDGKFLRTVSAGVVGSSDDAFFLSDAGVPSLIVNGKDGSVRVLLLGSKETLTLTAKDIFRSSSSGLSATPLHATTDSAEFVLASGPQSGIYTVKVADGKPKVTSLMTFQPSEVSETSKYAVCLDDVEKIALRFRSTIGASQGLLELVTLSNGKVHGPIAIPLNPRYGSVEKVFLESAFKGDALPGHRIFLLTSSGTVVAAKENEVLWTRHESLTETVGSVFVELPEPGLLSLDHDELNEPIRDSEAMNPVTRYIKRWTSHIQQLQAFAHSIPSYVETLSTLPATLFAAKNASAASTEVILQKDRYGFRKLLVFASKGGNVVAVETEHGNVAWTTYFPGLEVRHVEYVRSAVVRFPPIVAVVADNGKDTSFIYLNAITGELIDDDKTYRMPGIPVQVIKLPIQEEKDGLYPLIAVDKNLKISVIPNTPEAHAAFKSIISHFYFYLTEGEGSDSIHGYIVSELAEGVYTSKPVWEVKFGANEKLAALAPRSFKEKVASMGRVLGNRQVLYKYLNPNVLAVATLRETAKTTNLYVYLVDTVTGSLFHRSSFPGGGHVAKGVKSVFLAQTEHNVILSFYNHGPDASELIVEPEEDIVIEEEETDKKKRRRKRKAKKAPASLPDVKGHEVVVFEVFESVKPNSRMESNEYSSFNPQRPQIQSQSFVFPFPITAMGFTDTREGITTRELLVGLKTNQVYGINKRFLDTRRPLGNPTSDDKEEQLVAYRPVLDYNPREVISYHLDIAGVEKIVSSPSEIESTSLVAAYGLDLFFSRRAPSKVFDVLSEDFNYFSLILTVIALLIGIQVAKYFVSVVISFKVLCIGGASR
ncbi:hypothetical protein HDU67_008696 [Dinochytrium kinnereticum]|nr:hypothetical protein HDU67_008696 [Dinochytrium kinnereticum]